MEYTEIKNFSDDMGNTIISNKTFNNKIKIIFDGKNNKLEIDSEALIANAVIKFSGNNGFVKIGRARGNKSLSLNIRVGEDSSVILGDGLTIEKNALFFAAEGSAITVGKDCMFASHVQVRADDSHPTFDVTSGLRTNTSKDIFIGNHCWIGFQAILLKGTHLENGCCVGMHSLVTGIFPNNCTIAGIPARIIKLNTAWERPHLADSAPAYKPDRHSIKISEPFWKETDIKEIPDLYLPHLWENKEYEKIISYCQNLKKKNSKSYYFNGLALYHTQKYKLALSNFVDYIKTGDNEYKTKTYYCIANTFIRLKHFTNAFLYAQRAYINDPFNSDYISILIMTKAIHFHSDLVDFISEIKSIADEKLFVKSIFTSANRLFYLHKKGFSFLEKILYKYICSINYQDKKDSDTCYIITQPLLDRDYLFSNRNFDCSVLFLKIETEYTYFMPFITALLNNIISLINNRYKNIVITSVSAGAFLSLVLGAELATNCKNINIKVFAFSPQTRINNNKNIQRVTHYKHMQALKEKYPFFSHNIEKYGDINKLYLRTNEKGLAEGTQLSVQVIFGDALVDLSEAEHVKNTPFITLYPLDKFPFHSSMAVFRYDKDKLHQVYESFESLKAEDIELQDKHIANYSIEKCIDLKTSNNYNLSQILPLMSEK